MEIFISLLLLYFKSKRKEFLIVKRFYKLIGFRVKIEYL